MKNSSHITTKDPEQPKINTVWFLPVAALPQWGLSVKVVQLLGLRRPWQRQAFRDTNYLQGRSYGSIRVFFQASCRWRSEGLFGQSFSVALPIQALKGAPWVGSYSVVQCVRRLMGQTLYSSAKDAGSVERGAMVMVPLGTCDSALSPCFHGCLAFLHRHFPPRSPPSHSLNPSLRSQQQPLRLLHNP